MGSTILLIEVPESSCCTVDDIITDALYFYEEESILAIFDATDEDLHYFKKASKRMKFIKRKKYQTDYDKAENQLPEDPDGIAFKSKKGIR